MKIVTQDYGCGTSSSILDYGIEDVIIVSNNNFEHVFEIEDDIFFVGHDVLYFMWQSDEHLQKWIKRSSKWEHWVWSFERIDAIVPFWQQKSHESLAKAAKFCSRILACDEDDCDKYGYDWLPQWASRRFHDQKSLPIISDKILFSGQAGKPEYGVRNQLLNEIMQDDSLKNELMISNIQRNLIWDDYIKNLLSFKMIMNPVGVIKSLNTRAYEVIYSGRILLQQTIGDYKRHQKMLEGLENVIFFENLSQLKHIISKNNQKITDGNFEEHSLHARMRSIGVQIK